MLTFSRESGADCGVPGVNQEEVGMLSNRTLVALLGALLAAGALHCASKPFATGATIDTEYDFANVNTLHSRGSRGDR